MRARTRRENGKETRLRGKAREIVKKVTDK